jgi:N-acetylglucosamine malate deacetylase 1
MTPYHSLVADYVRLLHQGRAFPLGAFSPAPQPELAPDAPRVLFFAPHPDDECIVGGMALRLFREAGMKVVDVAVTLGSNKARQAERLRELQNACDYVGFGLVLPAPNGLEKINSRTRELNSAHWSGCVEAIRAILAQHQPKIVFCPHDRDWNSTHVGVHHLVLEALSQMPVDFECYLVETEFWGAMRDPNLMVEISANDVADLIAATTFHIGEVRRNPYHLLLPAWMMDNVRRGAEVAGGQGGAAPDFAFATLYRLRKWSRGQPAKLFEGGKQIPVSMNIGELFP